MEPTNSLIRIMERELRRLAARRIYLFIMVIAPVVCCLFFADLFKEGVPDELPVAVVDKDNSSTSRALVRSLDAFGQMGVVLRTDDFELARKAMQRGEIYGIFYIPVDFKQKASTGKEPLLSFYTNDSYILPGSLVYKDMRMQSALANGVVQRTLLLAKGGSDPVVTAKLMPIAVDTHPLNNPWLSYAVYLSNVILPAFLCMFIMFTTSFSIGEEIKDGKAKELMDMAGGSVGRALAGKLLPQAFIFLVMGLFCQALLYRYLHFPINSGIFPMLLGMALLVFSSQALALFATGLFSRNRMALSACALWGVLAFSITGFTFPVRSMPVPMQWFSNLFPMRHYFLIYVDQALNGIPLIYSWHSYVALLVFLLLPLIVLPGLKRQLIQNRYLP